jgi:hypothetical protein
MVDIEDFDLLFQLDGAERAVGIDCPAKATKTAGREAEGQSWS